MNDEYFDNRVYPSDLDHIRHLRSKILALHKNADCFMNKIQTLKSINPINQKEISNLHNKIVNTDIIVNNLCDQLGKLLQASYTNTK